jgi:hypothetical protein
MLVVGGRRPGGVKVKGEQLVGPVGARETRALGDSRAAPQPTSPSARPLFLAGQQYWETGRVTEERGRKRAREVGMRPALGAHARPPIILVRTL